LAFGTGIDLVEVLLGLEEIHSCGPPASPRELKACAVISQTYMAIERNVIPLLTSKRATAVGFDLPKRPDGLSITCYRAEGIWLLHGHSHAHGSSHANMAFGCDFNGAF
jgi:hypothetical protein